MPNCGIPYGTAGSRNWQSTWVYQQRRSSGMGHKSRPDHLAATTERSCELKLWLKRCGWKSFWGIDSVQKAVSTEERVERSLRSSDAESLKCIFSYSLSIRPELLGLFNMVLKSSDSVTMFFAAQETLEQKFSSHFGRMEFFYCLVEKTKQNLCWPLILEERSEWDMGPPDCEGVPSTPTVPRAVHKLPELTLNASTDFIWKHQDHVCSLVNTRSFCPRNLHGNETLGFYLQPVANWYDIGHPVLSPQTPKISSFHPCMAFYSSTVLRFWCICKMPEIFT